MCVLIDAQQKQPDCRSQRCCRLLLVLVCCQRHTILKYTAATPNLTQALIITVKTCRGWLLLP